MKKYLFTLLCGGLLAASGFLASCDDDDEPAAPTIELSETAATAEFGDEVEVDITTVTPAGFKNLVVKKLWEGVEQDAETFTTEQDSYVYTVTEDDAEHIVTLNFTVTDSKDRTASTELVITIELTPRQILLKYNWRLDQEIRKKTNTNDISEPYNDDIYRFNADGTYNKSIGAKSDGLGDELDNYCYYDLNDNTLRLLMSRSGAFGAEVTDTLDIVLIDETKLHADVTYRGLDIFDPSYDPIEFYEKRFVAVPKTASFDPYKAGTADDAGPKGSCTPVEFEND